MVLLVVRVGALDLGRQILNRRSKEVVPEKGKIWTLSKHLTINFTQTHTSKHTHTHIYLQTIERMSQIARLKVRLKSSWLTSFSVLMQNSLRKASIVSGSIFSIGISPHYKKSVIMCGLIPYSRIHAFFNIEFIWKLFLNLGAFRFLDEKSWRWSHFMPCLPRSYLSTILI